MCLCVCVAGPVVFVPYLSVFSLFLSCILNPLLFLVSTNLFVALCLCVSFLLSFLFFMFCVNGVCELVRAADVCGLSKQIFESIFTSGVSSLPASMVARLCVCLCVCVSACGQIGISCVVGFHLSCSGQLLGNEVSAAVIIILIIKKTKERKDESPCYQLIN